MDNVYSVQDGNLIVYYDKDHNVVHVEEILTDAECDRYAVDVMNGNGYYNSAGKYVSFSSSSED